MKINLIGMILNNAGRRCFDGAILDDNGKPMTAADSLHHMIMEYAKVASGGESNTVSLSREVTWIPMPEYQPNAASHDKAALYEKLRRMSPGEFKKLVDQKVCEGKDFDELVAAWPETI